MGFKKTHKILERINTYSLGKIFGFLNENPFTPEPTNFGKPWMSKFTKQYYIDSNGNKMSVRRARVFLEKGVNCKCGLEGSFFSLDKWPDGSLHLDLYAKDKKGVDVLMTIDHVFPKSKGGADNIKNYEPMCKVCNETKADKINTEPTMKRSKQVIVMRKDLKMRRGKEIAQGAHASLSVFLNSMQKTEGQNLLEMKMVAKTDSATKDWIAGKFTKICVYVESEKELVEIYEKAHVAGLPCSLIRDAGDTEFHGVPTLTCCAIGPAWEDEVNAITGNLKLL
jgi:PTH2 family peptidyl-tRNA hydrolase